MTNIEQERMTWDQAANEIRASAAEQESAVTEPEVQEPVVIPELEQEVSGTPEENTSDSQDEVVPDWNLDINALPEDLQPFAKSLQGDYTRKTQVVAELRKQYEGLGDVDSVAQAVTLARAFQADPVGTLHKVEEGMREMGLLETQANIQQAPQETPVKDPVLEKLEQEYGSNDPLFQLASNLHSELKDFQAERQAFKAERLEAEKARAEREQEEYFLRTENVLRTDHKDWEDQDFDAIYDIVIATGGDLSEAAKRYEDIGNRFLTRYITKKTNLPTASGGLPATGPGHTPTVTAKTLAEGAKNAKEELELLIASGDFSLENIG